MSGLESKGLYVIYLSLSLLKMDSSSEMSGCLSSSLSFRI